MFGVNRELAVCFYTSMWSTVVIVGNIKVMRTCDDPSTIRQIHIKSSTPPIKLGR